MDSDRTAPVRVRGLVVPDLLVDLLRADRWRHPGEAALARTMPWFKDSLVFLAGTAAMERQSQALDRLGCDARMTQLFRLARGSTATVAPVELPWLDVDQAFFIAVAKYAGDDTAVALDYRTGALDPRVVASDVWTRPSRYEWRVVAQTLSAFTAELGLTAGP